MIKDSEESKEYMNENSMTIEKLLSYTEKEDKADSLFRGVDPQTTTSEFIKAIKWPTKVDTCKKVIPILKKIGIGRKEILDLELYVLDHALEWPGGVDLALSMLMEADFVVVSAKLHFVLCPAYYTLEKVANMISNNDSPYEGRYGNIGSDALCKITASLLSVRRSEVNVGNLAKFYSAQLGLPSRNPEKELYPFVSKVLTSGFTEGEIPISLFLECIKTRLDTGYPVYDLIHEMAIGNK